MRPKALSLISLLMIAAILIAACGGAAEPTPAPAAAPTVAPAAAAPTEAPAAAAPTEAPAAATGGKTTLGLWTHSAGNEGEMKVITKMVDDFNAKQDQVRSLDRGLPPGILQRLRGGGFGGR